MNDYFADTVFFLALLSKGDQHHHQEIVWRDRIDDSSRIVTTRWVLTEVLNGSASTRQRTLAVGLVSSVLTGGKVYVFEDGSLYHSGLDVYRRHSDKHWSLTDWISFVVMKRLRITHALTADRHFVQAGFKALLR